MQRLKGRLTYANVMATIAVFVALGGSSYAALTLPRNSVGAKQIRKGAVGTSELHDRSVRLRDMSTSARKSLRGATGAQGPAGATGAPAAKFFAAVSASGALLRGNATNGGRATAIGTYVIGFAESVGGCAYSATLGTTDGSATAAGRITVNDQAGRVGVQTYDAAGNPADLPFHLLVAC